MRPNLPVLFSIVALLAACRPAVSPDFASPTPGETIPQNAISTDPSIQLTDTPTEPPPIKFSLYEAEGNSILPIATGTDFSGEYTDPGAVIYHDGLFHMFYDNLKGFPPREVGIGYATSPDGITWTRVTKQSILRAQDIPYDLHTIGLGSVTVDNEGLWVLYFYTRDTDKVLTPSRIGRATASAPEGPWKVDEQPILEPDPEGWDAFALQRPSALLTESGFFLYYLGLGAGGENAMIGMAYSEDGIKWRKYNDPKTNDPAFAHSDPVFRSEDAGWGDEFMLKYPRIKLTPDGLFLFYHGNNNGRGGRSRIGVATSPDGIHWQRIQDEPVFTGVDTPQWNIVWVHNEVFHDGKYYMFIEVTRGSRTYINLATYEGQLPGIIGDLTPNSAGSSETPTSDILPEQIVDEFGHAMRLVPDGAFSMGSEGSNGPIHEVTLSDYYIDMYEVTNSQFAALLNDWGNQSQGGSSWLHEQSTSNHIQRIDGLWQPKAGFEDHPVVEVTWYAAQAYCGWRGARLPTEAEWEKAARGDDQRTYPWGEEIDCAKANYNLCGVNTSVPVDSYPEGISPYGIFNLAGNVGEWTADWYALDYYEVSSTHDPQGPQESPGNRIASRGGSWYSTSMYLRSYHRNHEFNPTDTLRNVGFRCAVSP